MSYGCKLSHVLKDLYRGTFKNDSLLSKRQYGFQILFFEANLKPRTSWKVLFQPNIVHLKQLGASFSSKLCCLQHETQSEPWFLICNQSTKIYFMRVYSVISTVQNAFGLWSKLMSSDIYNLVKQTQLHTWQISLGPLLFTVNCANQHSMFVYSSQSAGIQFNWFFP